MKISGLNPFQTSQVSKKKRKQTGSTSGFSSLLDAAGDAGEAADSAAVSEAAPASSISSMLSIQEVSEEQVNRQRAIRQGRMSIEALEELRDQLLMGEIPTSTLHRLESMVQMQRQETSDPRLNEILDEIELRTAVELAKIERAKR